MDKKVKEWHLIQERKSPDIDKLFDVYRLDPKKARILYFNNRSAYTSGRVVMFKEDNGDFSIVSFTRIVGISKTNRIYTREKREQSIIYKGNKFYYSYNTRVKRVTQLTYGGLKSFIGSISGWSESDTHPIMKAMIKKFTWIRFIAEESLLHGTAFNSIVRYKLYNRNNALKHIFKAPLPVINFLKLYFKDYSSTDTMKIWKEMQDVLINPENLKSEVFQHHLFRDTCLMARTLDKKINCSWSLKRLTQEHDNWSREITNTVLEFEIERILNVNPIFKKFGVTVGYNLLGTNKQLLHEGMTQKHCVGTYIDRVDKGSVGIYHISGHTLELGFGILNKFQFLGEGENNKTNNKYLNIVQFRGRFNKSAPEELNSIVQAAVTTFNKGLAKDFYKDDRDLGILSKDKTKDDVYHIDFADLNQLLDNELPF